jgi:hypothetical protein
MADKWLIANGNTSVAANWNDGLLPGVYDDCYADGHAGVIDTNITVLSIRTTERTGGTVGGSFTIPSTVTINCTGLGLFSATSGAATGGLIITANNPSTITINSIVNGGVTANCNTIYISGTANVNITGNCINTVQNASYSIIHNSTGLLTILGDVRGGSSGNSHCILISSSGNINVTGNVTSVSSGIGIYGTSTGTITVTGNVTGSGGNSTAGINSTGAITIIGNVTGGTYTACYGIVGTNSITVTGIITGGSNSTTSYGIYSESVNNITVIGSVNASNTTRGIYATTTSTIDITGIITANLTNAIYAPAAYCIVRGDMVSAFSSLTTPTYGITAIVCSKLNVDTVAAQKITLADTAGTMRTFSTSNAFVVPVIADVRETVVYGAASELTGTLIVPPPASVALNVPTDHTVGTLEMSPADFWSYANRTLTSGGGGITAADVWDHLLTAIATPGSIGDLIKTNLDGQISDIPVDVVTEFNISLVDVAVRMQNASTVETTGDQIAALP